MPAPYSWEASPLASTRPPPPRPHGTRTYTRCASAPAGRSTSLPPGAAPPARPWATSACGADRGENVGIRSDARDRDWFSPNDNLEHLTGEWSSPGLQGLQLCKFGCVNSRLQVHQWTNWGQDSCTTDRWLSEKLDQPSEFRNITYKLKRFLLIWVRGHNFYFSTLGSLL